MLTLSSSATMSHDTVFKMDRPILIRVFSNVIALYTSMNVIGSTRWISISINNTPLRQISSGSPQSNADIFNLDSHAIHDIILPLHMRYPCQSHFNLYTTNTRISIIVTHASIQCSATPWFRSSSTCASLGQELPGCTTLARLHSRWPWSSTGSVFSWTPHPQLLFHFA